MNNTRVFSLLVVLASVSLASTEPIEGLHPRITVDRVRGAIAESFRMASKDRPMAEPKDWMTTFTPVRWLIDGGAVVYEWNITESE